jgi:hypothetical protein
VEPYNITPDRTQPDVNTLLSMMDEANIAGERDSLVQAELSRNEWRNRASVKLREAYQIHGIQVSDELISETILQYERKRYSFEKPTKTFQYHLAQLYVRRRELIKTVGIPVLIVSAVISTLVAGLSWHKQYLQVHQHKVLEQAIEKVYVDYGSIRTQITTLFFRIKTQQENLVKQEAQNKSWTEGPVKFVQQAKQEIQIVEQELSLTIPLLEELGKRESLDGNVIRESLGDFEKQLSQIVTSIKKTNALIASANHHVSESESILQMGLNLDELLSNFKASPSTAPFLKEAQLLHAMGTAAIHKGSIDEAKEKLDALESLKNHSGELQKLSVEAKQLHQAIVEIAKEDVAKQKNEQLFAEAKNALNRHDFERLQQSIEQLYGLEALLEEEYEIRIVQEPDVQSGVWRAPDEHMEEAQTNPHARNYYLIAEAVSPNGDCFDREIISEEHKSDRRFVTRWGERVSKSIYDKVKADKLDDGIIQNDILTRKRKGHITEQPALLSKRQGPILEW